MRRNINILFNLDWLLVVLYLLFVLMGWLNIYSAAINAEHLSIFDPSQKYGKQLIWIIVSSVIILVIFLMDERFYERFSGLIYVFFMLLLFGILFFGKEVKGNRSWYALGPFSLQPSELAKFATALVMAKYLSTPSTNLKRMKDQFRAGLIIAIPILLILLQPDTGSALVFLSFVFVMYREGLPNQYVVGGALMALIFTAAILMDRLILSGIVLAMGGLIIYLKKRKRKPILGSLLTTIAALGFVAMVNVIWENVMQEHHRKRILLTLHQIEDTRGIGYNTHQSMIAIGSGGFTGKGYLQGTQTKGDFVPEQHTDFIFCTIGEEWGFIGSVTLVVLYAIFLIRLIVVAERQRSNFARLYGFGVFSVFFFHFGVNLAMTMGLAPVIGIPLPFFSYGGSALMGFTLLLFILLKLDAHRVERL